MGTTSLAFLAAATTKLQVHTNILVLPYCNPFLTAKAAATLQVFSAGGLILGVGLGYQKGEFEALGVSFAQRGALMDEVLDTIRLAWRGSAVVKPSIGFNAAGNEPRPCLEPEPLIWIGGGSDKAVKRAARWGDGWSPFFTAPNLSASNQASVVHSVEQLAEKFRILKDLHADLDKAEPFDICTARRAKD